MMRCDFDKVIDRRNTNSLKWDVADGELPMWVADMDFQAAPEIIRAVKNKAALGVFGYQIVPEAWYDAIVGWWKTRHGYTIDKDKLCFCTGVIPAISSIVKRVTNHGDKVVLQTPVYDIFYHSVENAGRQVSENKLAYKNGEYSLDFDDLEQKLKDPLATMMILCNPHNPVGKIWTKNELKKIGDLCAKNGVTLLSDEIHCDLTAPDCDYVPFASVSETCADVSITCVAASKAFNIAGFQSAAVFAPNAALFNKTVRGLNSDEVAEPNAFAVETTVAAFTECGYWIDELRSYIAENRKTAYDYLRDDLPAVHAVKQNATYLLWVDCSDVTDDAAELCDFIRKETGLYITAGGQYRGNGKTFVRINAACPKSVLLDGLERFVRGVKRYVATYKEDK